MYIARLEKGLHLKFICLLLQHLKHQKHKSININCRLGIESILIVDDEDQIREITKKTLETHGYRVITANDGKDAIALYSQHRKKIKLVLMDMMMPVMDGRMSIQELCKANPEVKIVAVSGLTEKVKLEKIDNAQVQAFLMKPFTAERLLKTIHEVLGGK
jgi:CheY-like chemotaxis protein